jgi:squalene-hopene/tetraprenyl-beta-curcumene cyclase
MTDPARLPAAYVKARDTLLSERTSEGFWVGELSSSALATATAVGALKLAAPDDAMIAAGLRWLADHQNADGGWGDTVKSHSNISTTMLCRAAFYIGNAAIEYADTIRRCETWLSERYGKTPRELAEAVRQRYGKDRTFAVPILTMCALAGLVPWDEVPRLPFELACLPQSWYRFARLPVVSYALPALIAIGQCVHRHRGTWNPLTALLRWLGKNRSLRVLERIQPSNGGYLEATPLTSFVTMSLASLKAQDGPSRRVIEKGVAFIKQSMRLDGSWPIDTNLSIWVTTLSVNALAAAGDLEALDRKDELRDWLLAQQIKERHPYTGAAPGGWGWSHLPGSVPDCDDTPGAILALSHLATHPERLESGVLWMFGLQNRDGGFPTFCRGWGLLPFDRSGTDLTAHALRAWSYNEMSKYVFSDSRDFGHPQDRRSDGIIAYLSRSQNPDGSWLPLWFGNQHAADDINPTYGTAKVLAAYRDLDLMASDEARKGIAFLLSIQNADGGWGGAKGAPSSVEESALAVEVLLDAGEVARPAAERGLDYLVRRVEDGTFTEPTPIGFYFAKLWYFEKLYPIIFTVAALGRALRKVQAV